MKQIVKKSIEEHQITPESVIEKKNYNAPQIFEIGDLQELTQGSREQTSDEPGSGYKGG